jgi:hypothetical protein
LKICLPYWFGANCTTYCKGQNGTNGHYFCNKDRV